MKYYDETTKEFIFKDYQSLKPFASFLPGVAGKTGVPMWTYYVNRGQLIASFGIENKDHAILDFTPANLSYRYTSTNGFRTFIKLDSKVFEPFTTSKDTVLKIGKNSVGIEDTIEKLHVDVKYFNVTEKPYPGLVRKVTFKALSDVNFSFVDGLATFWPYGTSLFVQKNMANLAVAWFDVFNQENNMPFMKNRSTTEDTEEISSVEQGNFYVSINQKNKRLKPVYDPTTVFGQQTDLRHATMFESLDYNTFNQQTQHSVNQLLSAFTTDEVHLNKGETYTFYTLLGSFHSLENLNELSKDFNYSYFEKLEQAAFDFIETLTNPVMIESSNPLFDAYMKQAFLDNLLRGGYPYTFDAKNGKHVYHTFSRIHGDMEREYNNFYVEPSFYSHGNGSYRDVNQNRRNDVYFEKAAGLFNFKQFIELIQSDGHNPLTIMGSRFYFDKNHLDILKDFDAYTIEHLTKFLDKPFTPGSFLMFIYQNKLNVQAPHDLLESVLYYAKQSTESHFGTGYWSDHWIYNLDLIEAYLNIYPDKLEDLLFKETVRFYQSHMSVYPRSIRYVLNHQGQPRQLGPVYHDHDKAHALNLQQGSNFHKMTNQQTLEVNIFTKLLHLALIKLSSLDPFGMGVMMDSEKPGWNDAMNGLPAIFGSGLTETINLRKLLNYLTKWATKFKGYKLDLPVQIHNLFNDLNHRIDHGFDAIQDTRETFDRDTRLYFSEHMSHIEVGSLLDGLEHFNRYVDQGIEKASELNDGLIPTYLTFTAKAYEKNGQTHPHLNLPSIHVSEWSVRPLPSYLEAPAHYLKSMLYPNDVEKVHQKVKTSGIYDEKLGVYKTSASLEDETLEIGRARAFTKGWLERESSFVHMSYKYLIGMFKSGLYNDFYKDILTSMPPFMDPLTYGRSTLENVSFIATSNNPNPHNHGRGFVARLTGTTSEAITLMYLMFLGKTPFTFNEVLEFRVEPKLPLSFFKDGLVRLRFLSTIDITIHNEKQQDTFNQKVVKYELVSSKEKVTIQGDVIKGDIAHQIRDQKFDAIHVYLG
jgi:hypothetical protein